jgi:hypothetical protein
MAKDSQRLEQEFIATTQAKTGKTIQEWMQIIGSAGLDKPNTILKWLKEEHKLNHMQANFLTGMYLNGGQPVYDYDALFTKLFQDKDNLLPLYKKLQSAVATRLPEAEFIPTKTYVSIEGKRCFACATLTKQSIRVGLDLGDTAFDDYVQKARSLGAMPNLTHMVEISDTTQVDDRLLENIQRAYQNAHSK